MADRAGDHQQQAGCGRERCSEPPGSDQRDDPARQIADFRVGEDHDVPVDIDLVRTVGEGCVGDHALARGSGVLAKGGGSFEGIAAAILHHAVAVLVLEGDQVVALPVLEPPGCFRIARLVHRIDEVEASEGTHGRRGRVEQGDEHQRPAGRLAGVGRFGNGEEPHDHMRQTRGPDHQRQRDAEHIHHALRPVGIFTETEIGEHQVEFLEHV